jgi:hypothetical protein
MTKRGCSLNKQRDRANNRQISVAKSSWDSFLAQQTLQFISLSLSHTHTHTHTNRHTRTHTNTHTHTQTHTYTHAHTHAHTHARTHKKFWASVFQPKRRSSSIEWLWVETNSDLTDSGFEYLYDYYWNLSSHVMIKKSL